MNPIHFLNLLFNFFSPNFQKKLKLKGQNTLLDLCTDIHNTQQHLQDHCLALDQRVHQLVQQMDSWPEQLATAISQIQQKQLVQQSSAGLRSGAFKSSRWS